MLDGFHGAFGIVKLQLANELGWIRARRTSCAAGSIDTLQTASCFRLCLSKRFESKQGLEGTHPLFVAVAEMYNVCESALFCWAVGLL